MCAQRRDSDYLEDIQEAMQRIISYASDLSSFEEFTRDTKTQDAVIRNLEIIGEATKKLSDSVKQAHPQVPWREMAGMRDKMIHDYFGINYDIVWKVASDQVPKILQEIQRVRADQET